MGQPGDNCPDDHTLLDMVEGRLDRVRSGEVEEHVSRCPECRRLLSALARSVTPAGEAAGAAEADTVSGPEEPAASAASEGLTSGSVVDGYQILRRLGRGGMGEVFLARDVKLGRKVALKVIRDLPGMGDTDARKRFLFEARTTARFSHPHIVTVYGVGEHDGCPYLALEYLEGQSLAQRLEEERPSPRDALRVALCVAEALAEAHRHGVLHRDLKPANIMIPRDGRARVLDFGLAKSLLRPSGDGGAGGPGEPAGDDLQDVFETRGAGLRGSPPYMAPEQWGGDSRQITPAADVWALGVVLYQMTAGSLPFTAPDLPRLYEAIRSGPAPAMEPVGGEDSEVGKLIGRCLRRDPGDRPEATEVVGTLEAMLAGRRRGVASGQQSPFRGLAPFGEQHAGAFFGREQEVAAFLERLREQAVLPVTGPSGVGKSSFIQAGVIPRLKERGNWITLRLRPGPRPMAALAERLVFGESTVKSGASGPPGAAPDSGKGGSGQQESWDEVHRLETVLEESPRQLWTALYDLAQRQDNNVLLVVDQLEELFTHGHDEQLCRRFITAVCGAADHPQDPIRVVLVVRDDFLFRLVESASDLGDLGHVTFLRSPGPADLEQALVRPLEAAGYRFDDDDLPGDIVASVHGGEASLPLLQFTARTLWEQRDRRARLLRREDYESMGGVAGALARYADGVLDSLSPGQLELARQVLLRLVTAQGTRRVVPESEALDGLADGAAEALERLVQGRLVTARKGRRGGGGETELELVHEALIHAWTRLARWVAEDRESLSLLNEASQAAQLWEQRGRRVEEVWSGDALAEGSRLLKLEAARVPANVRRFLLAGLLAQGRRQRRRRLVRWGAVAILALAAAVSAVTAWVISHKEKEAQLQRTRAVHRLAQAQLRGARLAFLQDRMTEARDKLRASLQIQDAVEARALWRKLGRAPLVWRRDIGAVAFTVAFSPGGGDVAAAGRDGAVHLLDLAARTDRVLHRHEHQVLSSAFSANGKLLATGDVLGRVRLWRRGAKKARKLAGSRGGAVWRLVFDSRGRLWASSGGGLTVWDVASGRPLAAPAWTACASGRVHTFHVSPDGRRLAAACADDTVHVRDTSTGALTARLQGHRGKIYAVVFSPDGRRLATTSADRTARLWDAATGAQRRVFSGHGDTVWDATFSPGGRRLATSSHDQTIRVWDVTGSAAPLQVLRGHEAMVFAVSFSPDGQMLASAGYDQTARIWRTPSRPRARPAGGHTSSVLEASFSPDGKLLVSGSADRTVRLWDVASGAALGTMQGHTNSVSAVRFGALAIASGSYDGTVRLWDPKSGRERLRLQGHTDKIRSIALSAKGVFVASAGEDRAVRLWDTSYPGAGRVLAGHGGGVMGVAFHPGGQLLASAGAEGAVRVWSRPTGALVRAMPLPGDSLWGVRFSPGGELLAAAGRKGKIHLWSTRDWAHRSVDVDSGRLLQLGFHPDGKMLGVTTGRGQVHLVGLDGRRRLTLRGHRQEVNSVAFHPGGELVATASDDGTVRIWRAFVNGMPHWRAPLVLAGPGEVCTHRGWRLLSGGLVQQPDTAWRRAVHQRARTASATVDRRFVCLAGDELVERWDTTADRRVLTARVPGPIKGVVAHEKACLVQARGEVRRLEQGKEPVVLAKSPGASLPAQTGVPQVITRGAEVLLHGGAPRSLGAVPGARAALAEKDRLLLGYPDGSVRGVAMPAGKPLKLPALEDTPASAVTALLRGPGADTLIIGFASGQVGLWDLRGGARLAHGRVHGSALHLLLERRRLYAVSELGDVLTWDLEAFYLSYEELLRRVRR